MQTDEKQAAMTVMVLLLYPYGAPFGGYWVGSIVLVGMLFWLSLTGFGYVRGRTKALVVVAGDAIFAMIVTVIVWQAFFRSRSGCGYVGASKLVEGKEKVNVCGQVWLLAGFCLTQDVLLIVSIYVTTSWYVMNGWAGDVTQEPDGRCCNIGMGWVGNRRRVAL